MTTSEQPSVLAPAELTALARVARGAVRDVPTALRDTLAAKGLLGPGNELTPAGRHAINVADGGLLPGLDN